MTYKCSLTHSLEGKQSYRKIGDCKVVFEQKAFLGRHPAWVKERVRAGTEEQLAEGSCPNKKPRSCAQFRIHW